jgi:hypothetical protein
MKSALVRRALRTPLNLWMLVIPPTTWALHFLFSYVYAAVHCAKRGPASSLGGVPIAVGIATVIALAIVSISAYVAWIQRHAGGDPPPFHDSTDEDRQRFLATAKLLLAALSFIAIVFTSLPAFMFGDCR